MRRNPGQSGAPGERKRGKRLRGPAALALLAWLTRLPRLARLTRLPRLARLTRLTRLAWLTRLPRLARLTRLPRAEISVESFGTAGYHRGEGASARKRAVRWYMSGPRRATSWRSM